MSKTGSNINRRTHQSKTCPGGKYNKPKKDDIRNSLQKLKKNLKK